jgi:hypothetical protein
MDGRICDRLSPCLCYCVAQFTHMVCIQQLHWYDSNSRHVQRFWGASGSFWDTQWGHVYAWFDGNPLKMSVFGIMGISLVVYAVLNALLIVIDLSQWQPLYKYKVQPTEKVTHTHLSLFVWTGNAKKLTPRMCTILSGGMATLALSPDTCAIQPDSCGRTCISHLLPCKHATRMRLRPRTANIPSCRGRIACIRVGRRSRLLLHTPVRQV